MTTPSYRHSSTDISHARERLGSRGIQTAYVPGRHWWNTNSFTANHSDRRLRSQTHSRQRKCSSRSASSITAINTIAGIKNNVNMGYGLSSSIRRACSHSTFQRYILSLFSALNSTDAVVDFSVDGRNTWLSGWKESVTYLGGAINPTVAWNHNLNEFIKNTLSQLFMSAALTFSCGDFRDSPL
jgi:hypothetical protein